MIEWIIFIGITIIISEILFLNCSSEEEWIQKKVFSLFGGVCMSVVLFGIPHMVAYGCNYDLYSSHPGWEGVCVNHGIQVFLWYYGLIIGVVLFFWINKKLLQWKNAKK